MIDARHIQQVGTHLAVAAQLLHEVSGEPGTTVDPLMSAREMASYDLGRLLRGLVDPAHRDEAKLENDIGARAVKAGLATGKGEFIPWSMLVRDFNAGTASQAGTLIGTRTDPAAAWLRGVNACAAAGATVLTNLTAGVKLPYLASGSTVGLVTEVGSSSETNPTSAVLSLTPHVVTGYIEFSKEFDIQSPAGAQVLANDLSQAVSAVIDAKAIAGTGTGTEPRGVLNTSGIGDLALGVNGGFPAWADLTKLESLVDIANGAQGPTAYVTSPQIKRGLRIYGTGGEGPFWKREGGKDFLAGSPAYATTNIPINLVKGGSSDCSPIIYGRWSEMFIALFGAGIEIFVDPVTRADQGLNRMYVFAAIDVAVRNPACFAAIKDSRIPA